MNYGSDVKFIDLLLNFFCLFAAEPLYIDDLESLLDEAMLSLNTMTEDGSVEEVCSLILVCFFLFLQLSMLHNVKDKACEM